MAKQKSDAGVAVAQPDPSRTSGLFDGSRPLQLFLEHLPSMRHGMAECGAAAFPFSALNALPKIALNKWGIWPVDGACLVGAGLDLRVIPTGDREAYYGVVMDQLAKNCPVPTVPQWLADHLKKTFTVKKQQVEYLMKTDDVITPPGSRHSRLRNYLRIADRECVAEEFDPAQHLAEYLHLNRTWYRQNADLKFRTYDKTSIDWLLDNWQDVQKAIPDARCVGIRLRHTAQLIAFDMGCLLTNDQWTSYTHRFDRNAPVNRVSMFAYAELAKLYPAYPTENQGTADTTTIKAWKERLAYATQTLFTVSR